MPKATVTEIDKRLTVVKNNTLGIENYDIDNIYPQRVEDIISSSGTAALCVYMLRKFIFGGGFANKDFYKAKVNKQGLTADKLQRKVAKSLSRHNGVALQVNYNALFEKIEINFVPFKHCRLTSCDNKKYPNMLAIYDDWDRRNESSVDVKRVDYINFYNPSPEVIQAEVDAAGGWGNYKGQILYWTDEGLEYPLCPGDAVLEDMQTDAKIKYFKYRNVTTNFMASHIIEVDEFEAGGEGEDSGDKEAFIDSLELFQGGDEALKMLVLEKKAGSSPAKITKVEIQDVDKLYQYTEESVRDNIIRQYLIPPVLVLQVAGKLGTSTEIQDATDYYNSITSEYRLICEEIFTELFAENFVTQLNPAGDFTIIPLQAGALMKIEKDYFPYVTQNQILKSINLPEVENFKADKKPLYEALGVGGLQALQGVIIDTVLSPDQKIQILVNIFDIDPAKANLIIRGIAA